MTPDHRCATITLTGLPATTCRELLSGSEPPTENDKLTLSLEGEDVAVMELR